MKVPKGERDVANLHVKRKDNISWKSIGLMLILTLLMKVIYLAFRTVAYCVVGNLQMSCKAFPCTWRHIMKSWKVYAKDRIFQLVFYTWNSYSSRKILYWLRSKSHVNKHKNKETVSCEARRGKVLGSFSLKQILQNSVDILNIKLRKYQKKTRRPKICSLPNFSCIFLCIEIKYFTSVKPTCKYSKCKRGMIFDFKVIYYEVQDKEGELYIPNQVRPKTLACYSGLGTSSTKDTCFGGIFYCLILECGKTIRTYCQANGSELLLGKSCMHCIASAAVRWGEFTGWNGIGWFLNPSIFCTFKLQFTLVSHFALLKLRDLICFLSSFYFSL